MNKVLVVLLLLLLSTLSIALPEDTSKVITIVAQKVIIDDKTGISEYIGDVEVSQGTLLLLAELVRVITFNNKVVNIVAEGKKENPAKYSQSHLNSSRFIEASAKFITYNVAKGLVLLKEDAQLVQGFEHFSGYVLDYDIINDKVIVNSSKDGTKRVKFIIKM